MKWIEFFSFDWITRSANREWYFYYNNLIMFIAFFSLSLSSAGVLDAQTGPPHFDVGHPHVHRRSAVLGAPSAGLGRLGPQNWVRPAEGQRHLRVPGQHGTEDQPGDSAGRYRLVDLKKMRYLQISLSMKLISAKFKNQICLSNCGAQLFYLDKNEPPEFEYKSVIKRKRK